MAELSAPGRNPAKRRELAVFGGAARPSAKLEAHDSHRVGSVTCRPARAGDLRCGFRADSAGERERRRLQSVHARGARAFVGDGRSASESGSGVHRAAASLTAISDPPPSAPAMIPVPTAAEVSACPKDMVMVEGEYCTEVFQECVRWLDDEILPFARCAEYRSPARCIGTRVKQRFCIDRYEYTAPGEALPLNYQSFTKSNALCTSLGKRLCTESEWNFACEGEEMRPYPYGFNREPKCNQDRDDLYEVEPASSDPGGPSRARRRSAGVRQPVRRLQHGGQHGRVRAPRGPRAHRAVS